MPWSFLFSFLYLLTNKTVMWMKEQIFRGLYSVFVLQDQPTSMTAACWATETASWQCLCRMKRESHPSWEERSTRQGRSRSLSAKSVSGQDETRCSWNNHLLMTVSHPYLWTWSSSAWNTHLLWCTPGLIFLRVECVWLEALVQVKPGITYCCFYQPEEKCTQFNSH